MLKNELNACIFIVLFSNLCSEAFGKALKSAFLLLNPSLRKR